MAEMGWASGWWSGPGPGCGLHFNAQTEKSLITLARVCFLAERAGETGGPGRCTWRTKGKTFCAFYAIS